ncbi:CPBP family intramembrane glutamic endopeptidase [Nocardiopsis metallicus]|uniref:Membrane protease YdiL (CAAX protease family) n=1 Tax=Nocardiopsis metallicus TaxID=179819 RepID=A0A840WNR5_9ACTN|nr:type II CAAX endopeptidase family protein [Nocardiopsis metallicus]MBB5493247.1 membrane protease YdiL (CAAX protease family) [Nocardiopsis metallicus]
MTATTRRLRGPKPVPPGVEYHRVLAGGERRVGRGVLAIALLIGGMFGAIIAFHFVGGWIDGILWPGVPGDERLVLTPLAHAGSLVAVGLVVPWSMFLQRWLYGVRGATLSSVASGFRLDLFGRAVLALTPALLIALAVFEATSPGETAVWQNSDVIWLLVVTVLLVPLQSAGEEYGLRGLVFRVAASWGRGRWTSLILGIGVSSALFSVIHTASDPWWNLFYLLFSFVTGYVTWRTGGVEVAVVIHAALNTLTFIFWIALNADISARFDRSAGGLDTVLLITGSLVFIGTAAVVWFRTRKTGPATTPIEPDGVRGDRTDPVSETA